MPYYDSNGSKGLLEPFENLGKLSKHFVSAPVGQIGQIVPLFNLEFTGLQEYWVKQIRKQPKGHFGVLEEKSPLVHN